MSAIALYTAVYPGAVPFLDEWYASVQAQADRDFDLWISLDGLTETAVTARWGIDRPRPSSSPNPGSRPPRCASRPWPESPTVTRRSSSLTATTSCTRIASPRHAPGWTAPMSPPAACAWSTRLDSRWACRSRRRAKARPNPPFRAPTRSGSRTRPTGPTCCEPAFRSRRRPSWWTGTWSRWPGCRLHGLPSIRRHEWTIASTAQTWPESGRRTEPRVRADTALGREHFRLVLHGLPTGALPVRAAEVRDAAADVAAFDERVVEEPARLSRYVRALNAAPPPLVWSASVAHPPLRSQWTTPKEPA